MKKSILMMLFMTFAFIGLKAQQQPQLSNSRPYDRLNTISVNSFIYGEATEKKDYDYYMNKSRNNRTASWCLVGGGLVIAGIGALTFPKDYDIIFENSSEKEDKADAATALIVVGCAAMLSSIPFTVMSGVYKRKAKLMVSNQKTGQRVPPGISNTITGITVAISIGK